MAMAIYDINGTEIRNAYSFEGTPLTDVYDVSGMRVGVDEEGERQWLEEAVITALPNISVQGTKQGGCTDGTYIYQCSGDHVNYTYMNVIKYKISDGTYTVVKYNGDPNFGHANDMTYNPRTGYLYIGTMLEDHSIIVLKASDLSYVETIYTTQICWQIAYDRLHDMFYLSYNSTKYKAYDGNWNFIEERTIADIPTATMQGIETDGVYYYRILYKPNIMNVCRLTGELVANIPIPISGEPEAIMYDWRRSYYMSGTTSPMFNRIQMFE